MPTERADLAVCSSADSELQPDVIQGRIMRWRPSPPLATRRGGPGLLPTPVRPARKVRVTPPGSYVRPVIGTPRRDTSSQCPAASRRACAWVRPEARRSDAPGGARHAHLPRRTAHLQRIRRRTSHMPFSKLSHHEDTQLVDLTAQWIKMSLDFVEAEFAWTASGTALAEVLEFNAYLLIVLTNLGIEPPTSATPMDTGAVARRSPEVEIIRFALTARRSAASSRVRR
jgi:hypothetical protein